LPAQSVPARPGSRQQRATTSVNEFSLVQPLGAKPDRHLGLV
jgi:hypothetical protein